MGYQCLSAATVGLVAVLTAGAVPVAAATYDVTGTVTASSGVVSPAPGVILAEYPAVGSTGTLSLRLDGADSDPLPTVGDYTPLIGASVTIGGWVGAVTQFAGLGMYVESQFSGTDLYRIGTPGIGSGVVGETFAGGFILNYLTPRAAAATTMGDLRAEIESGNVMAIFSFNGTLGGQFVEFRFEQGDIAPVPLAGAGLFLLAGIGGLGAFVRRRRA